VAETAFKLEDDVGVKLGPVIVNGMYDVLDDLGDDPRQVAAARHVDIDDAQAAALAEAAAFRASRQRLQAEQVGRLRRALPLPQLHLPFMFTPEVGPSELAALADALADEVRKL
jgi:hypothetical protein